MRTMHLLAAAALTAAACGANSTSNVSITSQSSSFQSAQMLSPTLEMPDEKQLMSILLASDDVIPERRDHDCGVVLESLPDQSLSTFVSTLYSAAEDVQGGCEQTVDHPRVYSCHVTFSTSHGSAADWAYHLDVDIDHDHTVLVDSAHCAGTP